MKVMIASVVAKKHSGSVPINVIAAGAT